MKQLVRKWIVPAGILLVIAVVAAVLLLKPHLLFMAEEYTGFRCHAVKLTLAEPEELLCTTVDALQSDTRVTWDQSLMLINSEFPLTEDTVLEVTSYRDTGVLMNFCIQAGYRALSDAVYEKYGEKLYVSSSYRTAEEQAVLYAEDADTATAPGSSEHQAGLALDVYVPYYAGNGFIQSEAGRFVNRECWKYGFIIRYPLFGEAETGISYEPWHIRYVGEVHARIIYNNHITLEEYIDSLVVGCWYETDTVLISRQTIEDGKIRLPVQYSSVVISPDNTGCYLITVQK